MQEIKYLPIHMDADLYDKFRIICKYEHLSENEQIVKLIKKFIIDCENSSF